MAFETDAFFHIPIVEKTDSYLRLERRNSESMRQSYLGGIAKGGEVIWVNETKPLP